MFYTLGPMVSPLLGGVLIDTLGWRSVFGFAFFAGCAISAAAYLAIPETRPLASGSSDDSILRSYLALLAEPRLVGYVLQSGLNTASFMTMASAAATLMKELLQRPSSEFGLYFLLFPGGFFCGTLISSRVGSRVSNELMVLLGSLLAMATIMLQRWLFFCELVTPWTFFLPGFVLTFSQGIALPYAQVGAMAVFRGLPARLPASACSCKISAAPCSRSSTVCSPTGPRCRWSPSSYAAEACAWSRERCHLSCAEANGDSLRGPRERHTDLQLTGRSLSGDGQRNSGIQKPALCRSRSLIVSPA